jgi:AcrR family transcriptional regulator
MVQATTLQDRIIERAKSLFYSDGTRAVTMDELANELGISKKTLYQAYSSKDDLLQEILEREYKMFEEFINEESQQNGDDAMRMMFNTMLYSKTLGERISKRFFDELEKYHSSLFYEYWTKFKKECDKHVLSFMRLVQEKGYIYHEVNITIAHGVFDMMIGKVHELLRSGKYTEEELRESMMNPYLRGIFTAEGRRKLKKFSEKFNV